MRTNPSKSKPLRKPLQDVSNNNNKPHIATIPKQKPADDGYSLDRLLLVQSEISTLLHQIDGLVVQAFKLESMGQAEKNHIKSFTQFLSGTLDSLKPWVPKFENVLETASKMSSDLRCEETKSDPGATVIDDENELEVTESPEVVKTKTLVSPSPLVSWRDHCTVQRGKRLFLLTPLPKSTAKSVMSRQNNSVKPSFERFSSVVDDIPRFGLTEITCGDLVNRQNVAPTMEEKFEIIDGHKIQKTPGCKAACTSTFSYRDCSMLVMTPQFNMSPPKSCVLLEPVVESSRYTMTRAHKSTPYPAKLQDSCGSEMSLCSNQFNEDTVFKCPGLVGIKSVFSFQTDNKEANASLSLLMSPPKTCVLMEPSDLTKQHNTVMKSSFREMVSNLPEGTPMWKNLASTMRSGKRAGENTLKKELWTKFEAASSNDFSFYASPVQDDSHKGFMDRLEEASGEETIP